MKKKSPSPSSTSSSSTLRRRRRTTKKTLNNNKSSSSSSMKSSLARHLNVQLGQLSFTQSSSSSTSAAAAATWSCFNLNPSPRFQNLLLDDDSRVPPPDSDAAGGDERDFILSQDFFCTPDYITPDAQLALNDCNKNNMNCPKSPEKLNTHRSKRYRQEFLVNYFGSDLDDHIQMVEHVKDIVVHDTEDEQMTPASELQKNKNYVSQSAMALRRRAMPPPCIKNPYIKTASEGDVDPLGNQRSKCAGFFPSLIGGDGLSRYHTDFHEIEQIGAGNFSCVFKVFKRIDGCIYAVKKSTRALHQITERRTALMEVQAMAAIGFHENIVGYYSSWFENEQLYIQMEICDHSLSVTEFSQGFTETDVLEAMHQIAKALQFIHDRGISHLDVKLENIYVKNGIYKLGDFGCATLIDKSLPIEEGDARYMPQEILNDKYDNLDKVDIFSLGASMYELIRGTHLPESGLHFLNLREGKLPLLPSHSLQFQNLLKIMVDPDPVRRPSAKELVENPIFDRIQRNSKPK